MQFILFFAINLIKILKYAILARILISWIAPRGHHGKAYKMLHDITEPILKLARSVIPPFGMLDLSPILAYFLLEFIESGLIHSIGAF